MRQRAVAGEGRDVEVDAAALDDVGVPEVEEAGDEVKHVGHVLGGVGSVIGPFDAEAVHLLPPGGLEALRELGLGAARLVGPGDDLVLDVGDVRHERDVESPPPQVAADDVVDQRGAAVPDVGDVVDRGTTDVDRHPAGFAELEVDLGPLQRVVDADGHRVRGYSGVLTVHR